jgi:hypothetical protein
MRPKRAPHDPDRSDEIAPLVDAAQTAERARHAAERECERLRAELQATKGALKTAVRVLWPYGGDA